MSTITTSISTINSWQILEAENPDPSYAGTMVIYQNGRAIASGLSTSGTVASTITTAPLFINGRNATSTNSVPLYLAEVLLFTSALTSTQRTQVESYLAQKWSLGTSLPTGHINFTRPAGVPATTQNLLTTFTSIPTNQTTVTLTLTYIATISWNSYLKNITGYSWVLYTSATNAYAGTVIASGTTTTGSATSSVALVLNNYYYAIVLVSSPTGSYLATSPIVQYVSSFSTPVTATGGTTTTNGANTIHAFTTTGNTTFTLTSPASISAQVLIVAGGGGGGGGDGGGGGAGGVIFSSSSTVTAGSYTVTVGAGGTGAIYVADSPTTVMTQGGNSSFNSLTAIGGGFGGGENHTGANGLRGGGTGGSGGGAGGANGGGTVGSATAGQGNAGGANSGSTMGGGGGAGGAGSTSNGGLGATYTVGGNSYTLAGGGGGSTRSGTGGTGVSGGGAGGGSSGSSGVSGTVNTGGGGGGGSDQGGGGGTGGSGIVVISYPTAISTASTFSYTGANQTYTVPASVTSVQVYMWGAGGGGDDASGGAGAMVQGILTVTPGETLNIIVGGGGPAPTTTLTSAFGGGGAQGIGDGGQSGGGGGRAAIQRGGTAVTNDIVVAGAGGGGTFSSAGGSATFSGTANNGASSSGIQGFGGTQSAGGAGGAAGQYGTGTAGSRGQGGSVVNPISASSNDGGGGGSGYFGGGGGGTNGGNAGGGGGGSSFTGNLVLIPGQSVLGFNSTNGTSAPNTGSTYYVAGVAAGAINAVGGNGLVVIVPIPTVATSATALASVTTLAAPTSLTLSFSGSTATLGWGAVSGASSYTWSLYQSATNAYAGSFLLTGNSATTSATATSLTGSQYYYFTVIATSATAVSPTSAQSSIVFYLPYLPLLFTTFFANTGSIPNRSGPVIAGGNGTNWGSIIQAAQALDPIYFGNNHGVSIAGNANYSAITTGFVYSASVGTIQFQGVTDDGLIVNFNGVDVIDQYQQQGATTYYSGSRTLPAGYTPIRITWYDTGGGGAYDIYFSINGAAYTNAGTGVYFHLASATY